MLPSRTDRLVRLRPLQREDARHFARLLGDDQESILRMETMPYPCTDEAAREWIELRLRSGDQSYAVLREADRLFVGSIGMSGSKESKTIGYWIGRRHWGQGYATAAVDEIVQLARWLDVRQLQAETFLDNAASARVLDKAGFLPDRIVRRRVNGRGGLRSLRLHILTLT